jgi:phosphate:Na+ symporter
METVGPRLVRLCHALDHLGEIHDDLTHIPPVAIGWQSPAGFEAGAQALASWLGATKDRKAAPEPAIFKALEHASKQLNQERKTGREDILEAIALQRTPTAAARAALDTLAWADFALYHSWRLAESLRIASCR